MKGTLYVTGIVLALAIGIVVGANLPTKQAAKPETAIESSTAGTAGAASTATISIMPDEARRPEWETPDDPIVEFTSAVSLDGKSHLVVGSETWRFEHRDGKLPDRFEGGPKAWLCISGVANAIELELPKVGGTNKYFRDAYNPLFTPNGGHAVATLRYVCGDKLLSFVVAWDVASNDWKVLYHPVVIYRTEVDLLVGQEGQPATNEMAKWYLAARKEREVGPDVSPHNIQIVDEYWDY